MTFQISLISISDCSIFKCPFSNICGYEPINDFFKFSLISISNCTIFNCPFRNLKSSIVKIKIIVKHIHIMDLSLSPTPYWDAFDPLNQEFHEKAKQNIRIGKGRKKKNFFQSTISFFLNNSLSLLGLFHVLS